VVLYLPAARVMAVDLSIQKRKNGGYLAEGTDLQEKQPAPYLYDAPTDTPHPGKHQSGVGGPSDRNQNGVDDKEE